MLGAAVLVAPKKIQQKSSFSMIMNASVPIMNAKVSGTAIRSTPTYCAIVNVTNPIRIRDVACGKLS
jgi:hypothetical protein